MKSQKHESEYPKQEHVCGQYNQINYYCDENRYCNEFNQCGSSNQHQITQQHEYQYNEYSNKRNNCQQDQ